MTEPEGSNRVVVALRYLQNHDVSYWFDKKERVVAVSHYDEGEVSADEIASRICCLVDVRELQLDSPNLTDAGLQHLRPLVKLRKLTLESPRVTGEGFVGLSGMKRLGEAYFKLEQLGTSAFVYLAKCRNLVELSIDRGRFGDDDLAPLAALVKLERMSLNNVTTVSGTFARHWSKLSRLRKLTCENGVTDEGLACIAQLSGLETLYLEGPFTDVGLRHLSALKHLQTLGVISEHITDVGVSVAAELPQLKSLHVETRVLSDDVIPALLRCAALEDLSFRHACLSETGLQRLRDEMPRCLVADYERDRYEHEDHDEERKRGPRYESDVPFEVLLAKANDWDLVNGTFSKISDRYHNWVDASAYSPVERVIMLVWHLTGIIDNGGFEYLFAGEIDGDPDYHVAAKACKEAGLVRSYEAFQEAFSLFPGGIVPHDTEQRWRQYDAANRSAREAINRKLWSDGYDNLREKKLAEFIRKHAASLAHLNDTP
ncbi:MAG TPA: DUF4375 domain-containing protein [Pirellulales bacterium]|nr:DUF4375 domain-containing protein [Pirellulales bacterium]